MTSTIRVEREGAVMVIVIDRPSRRNAIDPSTATALADAFRTFEVERDVAVAVLVGEGGCFCAGADLKAVAAGDIHRFEPEGDAPLGPTRMLLTKPVIAAISGYAVAGGLELALWCDLRVMEEDAVMGCFERRWGVPLIDGGTVRLPRLIGLSHAMDLILTGRAVGAEEARRMGLVNRVVARGASRAAAVALAQEIAAFPQVCLRQDRLSAYEGLSLPEEAALYNEYLRGRAAMEREAVAGATRFAQGAGRHGRFETAED